MEYDGLAVVNHHRHVKIHTHARHAAAGLLLIAATGVTLVTLYPSERYLSVGVAIVAIVVILFTAVEMGLKKYYEWRMTSDTSTTRPATEEELNG